MQASSTQDIKQANNQTIYKLFFQYPQLSKPQIAQLLNLSLPTVVNNIAELEIAGKIREQGTFKPQGGRPATAYQLVDDTVVAISVEIQQKRIKCAVINLRGKICYLSEIKLPFVNNRAYIESLCEQINQFIETLNYTEQQILGIGFSIQGIANKDGHSMLYSKVLPCEHFNLASLQPYFKAKVKLFHDVKCAANAELWFDNQIDNAVYVSISEHLGGAIIVNNQIMQGKNGYAGALEHIQINSKGRKCYCGQKGCLETYCSLSALLQADETLVEFFRQLRMANPIIVGRWQQFLSQLARGLSQVYLLLEKDIILGGEISPYLQKEDIQQLQAQIRQSTTFPIEADFIRIATLQQNASLIGAGLPFIQAYLPH